MRKDETGGATVAGESVGPAAAVTGTGDLGLSNELMAQLARCLWLPEGLGEAEQRERVAAAAAALKGLAPRDELEGMLAAQMVATHAGAMECLKRAMVGEGWAAEREANLRQAGRLLAIYTRQAEALIRNRLRGRSRVKVEEIRKVRMGRVMLREVTERRG